jgi:hypothetical protein
LVKEAAYEKNKLAFLVERVFIVVKAHDLIQKSRFNLSLEEQRIVLCLIGKIKPEYRSLLKYVFSVKDFCQFCGLDKKSGGNYGKAQKH